MPPLFIFLRRYANNPLFSDLEIILSDDQIYHCHRLVVALHCPMLEAMIREWTDERGTTRYRVDLRGGVFDPTAVSKMLDYFYCGNYRSSGNTNANTRYSYVIRYTMREVLERLAILPSPNNLPSIKYAGDENANQNDELGTDYEQDEGYMAHSLFLSMNVYHVAMYFNLPALQLLARDRFYRTALLIFQWKPEYATVGEGQNGGFTEAKMRVVHSVWTDFPAAVRRMDQLIPVTNVSIHKIPHYIIAANFHIPEFRNQIVPVLTDNPFLTQMIAGCLDQPDVAQLIREARVLPL